MTISGLNKAALILALLFVLKTPSLQAQLTYDSTTVHGSDPSAFGQWTTANGQNTTAFGAYTTASGNYSTAFGLFAGASGQSSTAFGCATSATGAVSTAFGYSTQALGPESTAWGYCTQATGGESTAFGLWTVATGVLSTGFGFDPSAIGNYSTAFGYGAQAIGDTSTAFGGGTHATGTCSTAFGASTVAFGNNSTASGIWNAAGALDSFVIGAYNRGGGDPVNWVPADPIFEIGNGTPATGQSDALVVFKNGNTAITGTLALCSPLQPYSSSIVMDPTLGQITINGIPVLLNGGNGIAVGQSGRIGIGTTSPQSTLTVEADVSGARGGELSLVNYAGGANASAAINFGLDPSSYNANSGNAQIEAVNLNQTGGNDSALVFSTWNGSAFGERMRIAPGGNIGIGTSNPQATLDVNGSTYMRGTVIVTGTLAGNTVVASGSNLVLIPQQGDLSMGSFTAGATPQ